MAIDHIEGDLLLHRLLLGCEIANVVADGRANSIEMVALRQRRVGTVRGAMEDGRECMRLLRRIIAPQLQRQMAQLQAKYVGRELPDIEHEMHLYNRAAPQWHKIAQLTSRQIRMLLWESKYVTEPKLLQLTLDEAQILYKKIAKFRNVQNKTKLLRLLHGDVYCGARLYRFGLTDSDRCIRCFGEETTSHLLYKCPYSREVWGRLGLFPDHERDLINERMTNTELEIMAEMISHMSHCIQKESAAT
jgi:hypothetical protein